VVPERVVDILEMIEIDVEHRRRRAAATDLVDHGLESFTEIDAVGQPADGIVQGKVPQLRLAGGNRPLRAPHVAHHQADEHGQTRNRHGNEGDHVAHDPAAGSCRLPGKARDRAAFSVGNRGDLLVEGLRWIVDLTQAGQLQQIADFAQRVVINIFDGDDNRRDGVAESEIAIGADRHRRDDRRPVLETLDQGRRPAGFYVILRGDDADGARRDAEPPTQKIDARPKFLGQVGRARVARGAGARVFDPIETVDHHHEVLVKEILQPLSDTALDPLRIVVKADCLRGALRRGNALDFAQYTRAALRDRLLNQLPLGIERWFIGTPGGSQYRDDEASDRHHGDHSDRHDQAPARVTPA
jgi:hypothetical protein